MKLIITEKPSVARDIGRALGVRTRRDGYLEGNGLRISWCVGHMFELQNPAHYSPEWKRWSMDTLPMLPDHFSLRLREGMSDHWKVLNRLLNDQDTTEVINACDAGREGELIFRYVYQVAGSTMPVQRLWVSSLTDQAIQTAWNQLRPGGQYDTLADAARCRSEADWLVGLNVTRAMTCLARSNGGEQLLSVGRVQTPTLAMIVKRDQEIAAFVPEPFWQVKGTFAATVSDELVKWQARWFRPGPKGAASRNKPKSGEVSLAERLPREEDAQAVAAAAQGQVGVVGTADRTRRVEKPPLLYDLTSLQRRANQRYGFAADYTLQLAQNLYEKHKLISYPRTDARYLTPDQVPHLPGVVDALANLPVYQPHCQKIRSAPIKPGKRVINAAEVGDHHAILPTGKVPSSSGLDLDHKRLFDLVARRFLAVLSEDALFDITTLIVDVAPKPEVTLPEGVPTPLKFRARGKICNREGWRAVDPPGRSQDTELPAVQQGQPATAEQVRTHRGETRPPRRFSDASLLRAMETAGRELDDAELKRAMRGAGLGTPATRAAIIQTLLKREYIVRKGREVHATDRGTALITAMPVEQLASAELTGSWEARLSAMAEGQEEREAFMADVRASLGEMIAAIRVATPPPAERIASDAPVLGQCPVCQEPVRERRSVYACDRGRACEFVVFKTMSKRKISKTTVKQLLTSSRSKPLKNFKSKKGNTFEASLMLDDNNKVVFDFSNNGPRATPRAAPAREASPPPPKPTPRAPVQATAPAAPESPVGMSCPRCGEGRLIAGRSAWGCGRWREGCRYVLPFSVGDQERTPQAAAQLVAAQLSEQGSRSA